MSKNTKEKLYDTLNSYGHIFALLIIGIFTLFTRLRGRENLTTDAGELALLGNDSWYHYRAVSYTIENFPFTIGVDPKSGYAVGADVGTFGTFYDQIHAFIALILGLGNPSDELVRQVLAYSSPIATVAVVIVLYFLTKYITGSRWAGVGAAGILALIPGTFYERTVVGFAQHHVFEVLFMLISVLLIMKALDRAEKDTIIFELIRTKDIDSLKPWLKYVGLAALGLFVYYLTWPPAMMMFGLIAIAAVVHTLLTYNSTKPTEPALLTFAVLSLASILFVLVQIPTMEMSVSNPSILHLGVAVISFVGVIFMFGLNRYANENKWEPIKFYIVSISVGIISTIIVSAVQPSILTSIFDNILRLLGFPLGIGGESVQTIAEEQSTSIIDLSFSQYGLLLITAILGIAFTFADNLSKQKASSNFVVIMGVYFTVIAMGTVRFNYYLAAIVAVFSVVILKQLIDYIDIPDNKSDIEGYHVLSVMLVVLVLVPILFYPIGGTVFAGEERVSIDEYQQWEEPLMWMNENTEDDLIPSDESVTESPYEYDEDAYGVMSWWDYGHWITVTGDRSPVSNPFQQHAEEASEFLLADDPESAEAVMTDMDENAEARYVVIDWQTASPFSKFNAMAQFNDDVSAEDMVSPYYTSSAGTYQASFFDRQQRYYESMSTRLYYAHGSQMEPGPYTVEYTTQQTGQQTQEQQEQAQEGQTLQVINPAQNPITKHNSTEEAREYADSNDNVRFGGVGLNPQENVEALEQYRLVKSSPESALDTPAVGGEINQIMQSAEEGDIEPLDFDENPSAVKVFERVEGAEVIGSGAEPGETVQFEVDMIDPTTGLTFSYVQDTTATEDGTFDVTLPYSTSGYTDVENPPEVMGQSEYVVSGETSDNVQVVDIEERDVIEDTEPKQITLESEDNVDLPSEEQEIEIDEEDLQE